MIEKAVTHPAFIAFSLRTAEPVEISAAEGV